MNQVLGSLQPISGTARPKQLVPKETNPEHRETVLVFLWSCYLHLQAGGPKNEAEPRPAAWEAGPEQLRPRCSLFLGNGQEARASEPYPDPARKSLGSMVGAWGDEATALCPRPASPHKAFREQGQGPFFTSGLRRLLHHNA